MFSKFFGGGAQQQPQPQQTVQQSADKTIEQKQVEYSKAIHEVGLQIAQLDSTIEKYQVRCEKADNDVKLLTKAKKITQAKTKIREILGIQKAIEQFEDKKNVFLEMKMQLEMAKDNYSSVNVLKNVNNVFKDNQKLQEELQDGMEDWNEHLQDQKLTDNLWSDMARNQGNQEEVDDELARYMAEAEQEEAIQVQKQMNQVPNINIPNQQKIPQQQQNNNISNAWQAQMNS